MRQLTCNTFLPPAKWSNADTSFPWVFASHSAQCTCGWRACHRQRVVFFFLNKVSFIGLLQVAVSQKDRPSRFRLTWLRHSHLICHRTDGSQNIQHEYTRYHFAVRHEKFSFDYQYSYYNYKKMAFHLMRAITIRKLFDVRFCLEQCLFLASCAIAQFFFQRISIQQSSQCNPVYNSVKW